MDWQALRSQETPKEIQGYQLFAKGEMVDIDHRAPDEATPVARKMRILCTKTGFSFPT